MSKILSIAEVQKSIADNYSGGSFKNISFNNTAIDGGVIGVDDLTPAEIFADNTIARFAVTQAPVDGNIFVFDDEHQYFVNKNINEYISTTFIPEKLTDLNIEDGVANLALLADGANTFSFRQYSYNDLLDVPYIPQSIFDLGIVAGNANSVLVMSQNGPAFTERRIPANIFEINIDDGSPNTVLTTDGTGNVSFRTINYNHLDNLPTLPTSILDLGITDGVSGSVLVTDGAGSFSFTARPIPQDLIDLGVVDGDAGEVLTTDGAGNYTFSPIDASSFVYDYSNLTNTPTIPALLTDLSISDGSSDSYLMTDGAGNFAFNSIQYSQVQGTPYIPTSLLDLGVSDGSDGLVLTANGDGTFEFRPMGGTVDYTDILNKPSIPGDLFDIGVNSDVVETNTVLKTDGAGEYFFANVIYDEIEGTPYIPNKLADLNIVHGTANTQVLKISGNTYAFSNVHYTEIEGTPFIPTLLTELNIEDGNTANLVLTTDANGTFTFNSIDYQNLENRPDEELAKKMAVLEDDSFINAIIFG